jgi:hypothetical protein
LLRRSERSKNEVVVLYEEEEVSGMMAYSLVDSDRSFEGTAASIFKVECNLLLKISLIVTSGGSLRGPLLDVQRLLYSLVFMEMCSTNSTNRCVVSDMSRVPMWEVPTGPFRIIFLRRPNLFAICNNTFGKWWETCLKSSGYDDRKVRILSSFLCLFHVATIDPQYYTASIFTVEVTEIGDSSFPRNIGSCHITDHSLNCLYGISLP